MLNKSMRVLIYATALVGLTAVTVNTHAGNAAQALADDAEQSVSKTPVAVPPVKEKISGKYPAMWRLADQDTEIYLFGTFHLLPPDSNWSSARMIAAMADTSVTYLEADVTSAGAQRAVQDAVQRYGLNPPGVTLSSTLGEERAAKLGRVAAQYGANLEALEPLRPWLASLTLAVMAYQQAGLDPQSGAEAAILEIAEQQDDEMRYLESGVEQVQALASLDDAADYTTFDADLAQFANFRAEILPLLEAWRTGNIANIELKMLTMIRDASPDSFDILFKRRNLHWRRQIKALMDGAGNYFIAVGVGHLVGDDSLVAMLRNDGYRVTRVQ